jgi:hypothetical protein
MILPDSLSAEGLKSVSTGILYTKDRPVEEIVKQLFNVGCPYNLVDNLTESQTAFHTVVVEELKYRGLTISVLEVLDDTFPAALAICDLKLRDPNFQHLVKGIHHIKPHIIYCFVLKDATVSAAKVMFLSTLLRQGLKDTPPGFGAAKDVINWLIPTSCYNRLNKLEKTNPEAFFYICKTCQNLQYDPEERH